MNKRKKYDMVMVSRAGTALVLRLLVSGYIVRLGWQVLSGSIAGESPIPDWASWAIFAFFVGAALFFAVFSLREFIKIRKAAVFPEHPEAEGVDTPPDA